MLIVPIPALTDPNLRRPKLWSIDNLARREFLGHYAGETEADALEDLAERETGRLGGAPYIAPRRADLRIKLITRPE